MGLARDDLATELALLAVPAGKHHPGTRQGEEMVVATRDLDDRMLVDVAERLRHELRLGRTGAAVKAE